jgi:hypothetical protein
MLYPLFHTLLSHMFVPVSTPTLSYIFWISPYLNLVSSSATERDAAVLHLRERSRELGLGPGGVHGLDMGVCIPVSVTWERIRTEQMAMGTRFPAGNSSIRGWERNFSRKDINGENLSPTGKRGEDREAFPIPVPCGDPLNLYVTIFLCTSYREK